MTPELPILFLETQELWREWLEKNHAQPDGVWLKFFKKGSTQPSMNYAQALDEALCFGWIDGQAKRVDDASYLQRFTPRRARSIWSQKNIEHVTRLTKLGKMTAPGQKAIDAAKADGRWARAYSSPKNAELPEDFFVELRKNPKAYDFFQTLSKQNVYSVYFRLQNSKKPETRQNNIKMFIAMFEKGQKLS